MQISKQASKQLIYVVLSESARKQEFTAVAYRFLFQTTRNNGKTISQDKAVDNKSKRIFWFQDLRRVLGITTLIASSPTTATDMSEMSKVV